MTRTVIVLLVVGLLAGCAHKELKAPCENVVALTAGDVPCDQPEPVNFTGVPSVFSAR